MAIFKRKTAEPTDLAAASTGRRPFCLALQGGGAHGAFQWGVLDRLLQQAPDWLEPEGLLGIISFHSLEDRRVKTSFLRDERLQRITRKPVVATEQEEEANPRTIRAH